MRYLLLWHLRACSDDNVCPLWCVPLGKDPFCSLLGVQALVTFCFLDAPRDPIATAFFWSVVCVLDKSLLLKA